MTFSELYERCARDVYRVALLLSGNRMTAEDIAAETFCRALLANRPIREGTVKAYLLTIARNLYRDRIGDAARLPTLPQADDYRDPGPTPELRTADRFELDVVLAGMQRLPEHERVALAMARRKVCRTRKSPPPSDAASRLSRCGFIGPD